MTYEHRSPVKSCCAVFSLLISSLLLAGCNTVKRQLFNDGKVSARAIRAYLDMPSNTELNQKSVQSAARAAFSPRMSEYQIYGYMQNHHISSSPSDSMAYYIPKDVNKEVVILLSYNPEPHAVVTYRIVCLIADDKHIQDVTVTETSQSI